MNGTLPDHGRTSAGTRLNARASMLVLGVSLFTTTAAPPVVALAEPIQLLSGLQEAVRVSPPAKSTNRERVKELYARSGLTWDQLGKAFGVSRRAVHHWATGGKLSSSNAATLAELSAFIGARPDLAPAQMRKAFFEPDRSGQNVVDRLRARHASPESGDISGTHLRPEQLAGC
jgi:transcriptional regulator with XRE-family HTH domain